MIEALYTFTPKDEPQGRYYASLLKEFVGLTFRLQDRIISLAGNYAAAKALLTSAEIKHRLPDTCGDNDLELLADLADLRTELEAQADYMGGKDREQLDS